VARETWEKKITHTYITAIRGGRDPLLEQLWCYYILRTVVAAILQYYYYTYARELKISLLLLLSSSPSSCARGESTTTTTTTPNGYKSRDIGRDDKNLHRFTSESISTRSRYIAAHNIIGRSVTYIILYTAYYPTSPVQALSRVFFRQVKNIMILDWHTSRLGRRRRRASSYLDPSRLIRSGHENDLGETSSGY